MRYRLECIKAASCTHWHYADTYYHIRAAFISYLERAGCSD